MFLRFLDSLVLQSVRFAVLACYPRLAKAHWYYDGHKYIPNPAVPRTVNDKWLWRKMFDHSPVFTEISDKLGVREWLKRHGIQVRTPDVLWVGLSAQDIPDQVLEGGVVVKANHGWNMNIFLPKPPEDRAAMNREADAFLTQTHGDRPLQWGYLGIDRRLFVERFVEEATSELKVYTFGSHVERVVTIFDRFGEMTADVWVPDANDMLKRSAVNAVVGQGAADHPLPECTDEALEIASQIGAHFDHMRVDFMSDGTSLWLGELTVYNLTGHFHGVAPHESEILDRAWDIGKSWFLTTPQSGWRKLYAAALQRRLNAQSA